MPTSVYGLDHDAFVRTEMSKLATVRYVGNTDKRDVPIFSYGEVAYYFGIPKSTLRTWIMGRRYPGGFFQPVIKAADKDNGLLSYYNLAELHVLSSARYEHKVSLRAIRAAIDHLQKIQPSDRPLISRAFYTDGRDIFIKTIADTENLTQQGQLAFKSIVDLFLTRIAFDDKWRPYKVFPLVKGLPRDEKVISMVAGVAASRPTIDGTGIPVTTIWQRYNAGENEYELADDYEIELPKIRRAIAYVEQLQKAA